MKLLGALFTLLSGCTSPKPPPAPGKAGTSIQLAYPILLLSTLSPDITVFENEERLTTTTQSSSFNPLTQQIIDSNGGLYSVKKATPVSEMRGVWRDMGTSSYRLFLEIKLDKQIDIGQAKHMVLESVRSPSSDWNQPPDRLKRTIERVQSYPTLADLIARCSKTWEWR